MYLNHKKINPLVLRNVQSIAHFSAKAKAPDEFVVFPNQLEENQSISLTCRADVGSPPGNITIWKNLKNSNTPVLIYTSNSINDKTDNCTKFINVTYTVTRDDNGASFQCSSQNNLTQGPGPSKDSQNISVLCRYTNGKKYVKCLKFCLTIYVSNILKNFLSIFKTIVDTRC